MTESGQAAIASFHKWNDAWNASDVEAQISQMHFPHFRLGVGNDLETLSTPDEFRALQPSILESLNQEGWHHTTTLSVDAVQTGSEKVHLLIRQSRQYSDNNEYNGFDTLWIFIKIDGRWGVQFRSSFLDVRPLN